ncbi:transposable element Tcb1 transposase [Trichonephila clavipes]|nr:transposable element Tcb1 transposase [Trichonephila clavipes]
MCSTYCNSLSPAVSLEYKACIVNTAEVGFCEVFSQTSPGLTCSLILTGLLYGEYRGSRTDIHIHIGAMTDQIYRDVILEQHVRLFRGVMGAESVLMDDNTRPHHAIIVNECHQSEDITCMDWSLFSPDLNPLEHVWDMLD